MHYHDFKMGVQIMQPGENTKRTSAHMADGSSTQPTQTDSLDGETTTPNPTTESAHQPQQGSVNDSSSDSDSDSEDDPEDCSAPKPTTKRRPIAKKNRRGKGTSADQRGNTSPFSGPQREWIVRTFPEFQTYLGDRKAKCEKRSALKTARTRWVRLRWKKFLVEFGSKNVYSCKLDGKKVSKKKWKKLFKSQYTNYIGNVWNKGKPVDDVSVTTQPPPIQGPLYAYVNPRTQTPRQIFVQENRELINEEVKKIRESTGQSTQQNLAIFQEVVTNLMDSLPRDKMDNIQSTAESLLNGGDRQPGLNDTHLAQSRTFFEDNLGQILNNICGYGPGRIGDTMFLTLYTWRDEDGVAETRISSHSLFTETSFLSAASKGLLDELNLQWSRFCEIHLPKYGKKYPTLKCDTSDLNVQDMRRTLSGYLRDLWDACQSEPIAMPSWEVIDSDRGKYIDSGRLPAQVRLNNPDKLSEIEVSVLVAVIQTGGDIPPFTFRTQSVGLGGVPQKDTTTALSPSTSDFAEELTDDRQPTAGMDKSAIATPTYSDQGHNNTIQEGSHPEVVSSARPVSLTLLTSNGPESRDQPQDDEVTPAASLTPPEVEVVPDNNDDNNTRVDTQSPFIDVPILPVNVTCVRPILNTVNVNSATSANRLDDTHGTNAIGSTPIEEVPSVPRGKRKREARAAMDSTVPTTQARHSRTPKKQAVDETQGRPKRVRVQSAKLREIEEQLHVLEDNLNGQGRRKSRKAGGK